MKTTARLTGLSIAVLAALSMLAPSVHARSTEGPRAEFPEFGIFSSKPVKLLKQPQSVSGVMTLVTNVRLLKRTRIIVGQLGRSFGTRFRVFGLPPGARIQIRTLHPALTHPKTGKSMSYSLRTRVAPPNGVLTYTGYTFDHRYELAEGIWKIQVLYQGKLIGEQSFKVVLLMN